MRLVAGTTVRAPLCRFSPPPSPALHFPALHPLGATHMSTRRRTTSRPPSTTAVEAKLLAELGAAARAAGGRFVGAGAAAARLTSRRASRPLVEERAGAPITR